MREDGSGVGAWLELDLNSDPIHGTLESPGGSRNAFTGWLGLTAAIEALRAPAERAPEDEPA